jgi:anti-anti-sigma factor
MHLRVNDHLVIDVVDVDGTKVAALSGELGDSAAPGFAHFLEDLAQDGAGVVVDLAGLKFMNSAGLFALLQGENAVEANGRQFAVTGATAIMRLVVMLAAVEDDARYRVGSGLSGGTPGLSNALRAVVQRRRTRT